MTNKEALSAVLQVNVPDNSLVKALLDNDMVEDDDYDPSMKDEINQCAVDVLQGLLSAPNVSEGGYSISYDRQAIQNRLSYFNDLLGIIDSSKPIIRNASDKW